ncbi:MAG: alpha-glucosidase/alpha-galactosidase [Phycisphaerae bacterium]
MKKTSRAVRKARRIKIAYIGGGSRGWAHTLMNDLALCPDFTGEVALWDIDRPMALLNQRWARRVQASPQAVAQWKYTVARSLEQALKGASFVFASIQPGPIEMMGSDINIPRKYGILHPVGDTVGPAGLVRSLRAVADYEVIARAIQKICPNAWVFNFTNPMTALTRTLHKVFPGIKAFGCCHEVFGTQHRLAALAKEYLGLDITRHDVRTNVLGVNHFTWIDKATYKGIDLIKLYERKMNEPGQVRKISEEEAKELGMWRNAGQVGYDLFKRFGIIAAAGERHLVEFVPFYLKDEATIHRWGVSLTPYSYRIERYVTAPRDFRKRLAEAKPFELHHSDEEAIRQMKALSGMGDFRTNVNLPNIGQHEGLPIDAVVETNAYFTEDSVKPEYSGRLPAGVEALVLRTVLNQEMIVEAGLKRDKKLAFQAILNDPLMSLTTDRAWDMFNEMLLATKANLPGWNI